MAIVTSTSGSGNTTPVLSNQALIDQLRAQEAAAEAAKAAAEAKRAKTSGDKYFNQRGFANAVMQQPQRDTGVLDKARLNANADAKLAGADRGIYQNLINGTGKVLGADQAIASSRQSNNAQQALANSTRGGLYAQAGAQQNSQRLQEMQTTRGLQEAARLRDEAKIMGAGMMGNSLEASRAQEAQRIAIEQANATNAANGALGFQGLQDTADIGLSNLAFNQDEANQTGENKLANVLINREAGGVAAAAAAAREKRRNQGLIGLGIFGL
jgi:hypothetical protein